MKRTWDCLHEEQKGSGRKKPVKEEGWGGEELAEEALEEDFLLPLLLVLLVFLDRPMIVIHRNGKTFPVFVSSPTFDSSSAVSTISLLHSRHKSTELGVDDEDEDDEEE